VSRSSKVIRRLAVAALFLAVGIVLRPPQSGATPRLAHSTPPPGFGEGAGFCASAVPGGYTLGDSFDDVYASGPANNSGSGYYVPASGSHMGFFEDAPWTYQCTELANRFVFDVWGVAPINGSSLDGATYASTLSSERHVPLVANGTAGQPYLPVTSSRSLGRGLLPMATWPL
jgi:hypothetical protein